MADRELWLIETSLPCGLNPHDTIMVYDEAVGGAWHKWTGIQCSKFLTLDPAVDDGILLGGSSTGGLVYQILTGTSDNGEVFSCKWETPWLDDDRPEEVKTFRKFYLHIDQVGKPVTISWSVDGGASTGLFKAFYQPKYAYNDRHVYNDAAGSVDGGAFYNATIVGSGAMTFDLPQVRGRRIKFTFEDQSATTKFRILGFDLFYRPRRTLYPSKEGG